MSNLVHIIVHCDLHTKSTRKHAYVCHCIPPCTVLCLFLFQDARAVALCRVFRSRPPLGSLLPGGVLLLHRYVHRAAVYRWWCHAEACCARCARCFTSHSWRTASVQWASSAAGSPHGVSTSAHSPMYLMALGVTIVQGVHHPRRCDVQKPWCTKPSGRTVRAARGRCTPLPACLPSHRHAVGGLL